MKERSPYDPYVEEAKKSLEVGVGTTSIFLQKASEPLVNILKQEYYKLPIVKKILQQ